MRDLTRKAGLSRQAIHFYMAEGLLPPPLKTGRNFALYSHEHLEGLQWIQRLQREHFLSLNAIKAVLNGEEIEHFSPPQRALLRRVRDQLPGWAKAPRAVMVSSSISEHVSDEELRELEDAGLIEIRGAGADRTISQDDSDIIECFMRYRQAGATRERGYRPQHLVEMDRAIEQLVQRLAHIYAAKWQDAPVADAVAFVEAVTPIDERLMAVLLRKKTRALIDRVSSEEDAAPTARPQPSAKRKRKK
jgi:DNA-binding transcriptional MerR regulator